MLVVIIVNQVGLVGISLDEISLKFFLSLGFWYRYRIFQESLFSEISFVLGSDFLRGVFMDLYIENFLMSLLGVNLSGEFYLLDVEFLKGVGMVFLVDQ